MTGLKTHFVAMARYNRWANERLYATASRLPDEAYRQDVGLFFGSLHRTLNHLLVTDRMWLRRLTGTGDAPAKVDVILFENFDALREARAAEDTRIVGTVDAMGDADFDAVFAYTNTSGQPFSQTRWSTLAHVFNHQTHHRGQAHAALTRLALVPAPSLDLVVMQREMG